MALTNELENAVRRAEAQAEVAAVLSKFKLSAVDRRHVLLGLVAEDEMLRGRTFQHDESKTTNGAHTAPRAAGSHGHSLEPKQASESDAKRVLRVLIEANKVMTYGELANAVYGKDNADIRGSLRGHLFVHKSAGRAESVGRGQWRAAVT